MSTHADEQLVVASFEIQLAGCNQRELQGQEVAAVFRAERRAYKPVKTPILTVVTRVADRSIFLQ